MALAGLMTLAFSSSAFAQTQAAPTPSALATPTGHDLNVSGQHYKYTEPLGDEIDVKMLGPKFGAEYTGTFALGQRRRLFGQFNVRATGATVKYDGACRPWQIVPSSTSANGFQLTLGTTFPCSETGDADWYVDGRALAGRDFIGSTWAVSPLIGVGFRRLSNGTGGISNFRTQEYLYVPLGLTLRTTASQGHILGFTVEYDHLVRGWNTTRDSLFGAGTVPATSTTPAFTIGDFTDFSFTQRKGWAVRASANYQLTRSWSIEPYFTRWRVMDSNVTTGSVAYAVNGITARQTLSAYEPSNFTNEFGLKVGLHLGGR